jgi:2-oxoglutarate dehydrogenase E1 component
MRTPAEPFNTLSLPFVEALYEDFLRDPASVSAEWRGHFERLKTNGASPAMAASPAGVRAERPAPPAPAGTVEPRTARLQQHVDNLIRGYRTRGHRAAAVNPIPMPRQEVPELDLSYHGLSERELELPFEAEALGNGVALPLREIQARLRQTYCGSIGVEFMHIDDLAAREWLQQRMESTRNQVRLTRQEQLRILTRLTDAVVFEDLLHHRFPGAHSFSLEGCEGLIPLLDLAVEKAGAQGVHEIVVAMPHRGRLNVLANILGKSPRAIVREFEDSEPKAQSGAGDVRYHLGHSSDWVTASGRGVHLSLCFNPSHLEYVNPVAMGRMRAKQDRCGDTERVRGLVLMMHGDAAFAGEGIVQESLNLSALAGYFTGGTLHVVVNNQIGFTTLPGEGRSFVYATDAVKMLQIPVFHVNGEDPAAVAQAIALAMDFRQAFKRDVVLDMYCYRRHGHNESDEPSYTQPLLYGEIARHKPVRESYVEHMGKLGEVSADEAEAIAVARRQRLERRMSEAAAAKAAAPERKGVWEGYSGGPEKNAPELETGVPRGRMARLIETMVQVPAGFHLHPRLTRFMDARREMAQGKRPLDWGTAEALAFATLATEGHRVRMSGQDTCRGTFSQRHAVLHDTEDGHTYMPLQHLDGDQAPVEIYNSPLSEAAVLGFEYGYSLDFPEGLVVWEAQFGDFLNAAQVIADQFIATAEDKWNRLSGVVLLLPHGFEGMGPEHSSARLERMLVLAAEDNIQVVNPTTPAQYFHLLRRQVLRTWRKPLFVLTPKSLLRHPESVSALDELTCGWFERVLPDTSGAKAPSRVLLCTGKVYFELAAARRERKRDDIAILRIEQLYPFPRSRVQAALYEYPAGTPVFWVQEEPENMGAWRFLRLTLGERPFAEFPFAAITRPESASPATGSAASHRLEQQQLIDQAFGKP